MTHFLKKIKENNSGSWTQQYYSGFINGLIKEDYYQQINDTTLNLYIVKDCPEEINHNVIQINSLQQ